MGNVEVAGHQIGPGRSLFVIAGPCVLEDADEMLRLAGDVSAACRDAGLGVCFKSSYTKDNRTSGGSPRGPGREEGLRLLQRIKDAHGLPILTDIHHPEDAAVVAEVADILQIPAFLCRQSSLLEAAAAAGRVVNVKKGQFLAPGDMEHVAGKLRVAGCERILATERGTFFGYRDLVVDFRGHQIMHALGLPVVFDATHSVQSPGSSAGATGGKPELIPLLMRCGLAAGADAVFVETHHEPARALSDAGSQLPFARFAPLIDQAKRYRELYLEMTS
ncbi:3-deoxy-8-phosphooctulonate synthase [bacterium]|nr:3-deoxy-8-phosphooctulonate synthase [bacterium]MBU1674756.1 3-deoxy-8-phosphooctulonate synthase [bacterium]